jgi:1-acyl-sn-glycerol-3-phosphate acyltransferase
VATVGDAGTRGTRDAPLAYRLLRAFARALVGLFYRRIEVAGLEHVPVRGALIVAANHQNALVDPMLLLAAIPRRLVPVSKAPLFRHPLIAPLLRVAGAIPVQRRQDPGSDSSGNAEAFRAVTQALDRGEAILIFPEGVSQPEPTLMALRTGTARMLLGAEAAGARKTRLGAEAADGPALVTLLPVGLSFHEPGAFRAGTAYVSVGPPVVTDDCRVLYDRDPEAAARRLTDRLAEALRQQMVDAEDLAAAGISTRQLSQTYSASTISRYALREGLPLMLGLPLAVVGMALHLLPYQLTRLAVRALRPDPDTQATYKIGAGVVLYPLAWLAEGWIVRRVGGAGPLALFLAALAPSGFFAIGWRDRLARMRRETRGLVQFRIGRDLRRRLVRRRRALIAELERLAAEVPEAVLSGQSPDGVAR